MSRLQKKCVIAAALVHGLLIMVFLVGTAFRSKKKPAEPLTPVIELVNIVDAPAQTPGPAPQPVVRPTPAPPPEPVQKPPPRPTPAPQVKPEPKPPQKPAPVQKPVVAEKPSPKPPEKPRVQVDLSNRVEVDTQRQQREDAQREADRLARERERVARQLADARTTIERQASPSTTIESIGANSAAFANYADVVKREYNARWSRPQEISRDLAEVEFEVTIRRDGTVLSSRILRRSGVGPMDASIERLGNAVKKLPPFPDGASDPQRTFRIIFELRSNRSG